MRPLRSRPTLGRPPRAALLVLLASWACGGASSEPKLNPGQNPNPAVRITVVTAPKTTAEAGSEAGEFVVRVETASGQGVPNKGVQFSQTSGPFGFVFAPYTATTDSAGLARTVVTYRSTVGTDQLTATADGIAPSVTVPVTITPAPPAFVVLTPSVVTLFGAGDSAAFQVKVTDRFLNVRQEVTPVLSVSDPTALSVTPPAASGANGTVRALKGGVTATLNATALNLSGKLSVGIYPNSRNVCGGITPQPVSYGVPFAVTDSVVCLPATSGASTYSLMVYNASTDGTASVGTTVTGTNVALPLAISFARAGTRPTLARLPSLVRRSTGRTVDLRFHQRLLEQSRSLRRLFGAARTARSLARPGSMGRIKGPSYSLGSAAAVPAVDSLIALNVDTSACTTPDVRTFRVEAVGDKAIVLADTGNPANGFTRADYQRFADRFDQLVYPLDVNAFDAPTDIDGNGHVAILFTRAVNELTPANSGAFVGGFFHPRDLFPRTQSSTFAVCATSNEGEMFYMMVPDPTGVVNGNQFRTGFVDTLTTGILAHEFQHLINAGRRMYVNTSASGFEESWLNEGLSHEAQELLFFQESYYNPRVRLGASVIGDTRQHFDMWVADDAPNFQNFWLYLSDPANHSPIDASTDDLETRGAAWAFLRFAADYAYGNDAVVWKRFVNSTTTGIGTLTYALQTDPTPLLQAFALANMTKTHPTWNFDDVYTRLFVGGSYPLGYGALQEGTAVQAAARGGSASYYRFTVLDNVQALLRFGSTGAPADPNLNFVLLRTN